MYCYDDNRPTSRAVLAGSGLKEKTKVICRLKEQNIIWCFVECTNPLK